MSCVNPEDALPSRAALASAGSRTAFAAACPSPPFSFFLACFRSRGETLTSDAPAAI
jgi:hypothetical protein